MDNFKNDFREIERKNTFSLKCLILNRICTLIYDGESYSSVESQRMVKKLNSLLLLIQNLTNYND